MSQGRLGILPIACAVLTSWPGASLYAGDQVLTHRSTFSTVSGQVEIRNPLPGVSKEFAVSVNGQKLGGFSTSTPQSVGWDTTSVPNGVHSILVESIEPDGSVKSETIEVIVSNPSGWLQSIPTGVWTQRNTGSQNSSWSNGGKHMRLAHNPRDGRIYQLGGDFLGEPYGVSYRNDMYSYDIELDSFATVQAYCRGDNGIQPGGPDQVGWAYDSSRNVFWLTPGYMGASGSECAGYPGSFYPSSTNPWVMMTFDPVTRTWTAESNRNAGAVGGNTRGAVQYDPVTDTLIRFTNDCAVVYDIKSNAWSTADCLNATEALGAQYSAIDLNGRRIFVIGSATDRLYEYDIDRKTLTVASNLGVAGAPPLVDGTWGGEDLAHIVWDSVNEVVLYVQFQNNLGLGNPCQEPLPAAYTDCPPMQFHAFHPDTGTWQVDIPQLTSYDPDPIPGGERVRGNAVVFDPFLNVLLLTGNGNNMWLYRYGDGAGEPAPTKTPSAPANLRAN